MQNLGFFGLKNSFFIGIILKILKKILIAYLFYIGYNQLKSNIKIVFELTKFI